MSIVDLGLWSDYVMAESDDFGFSDRYRLNNGNLEILSDDKWVDSRFKNIHQLLTGTPGRRGFVRREPVCSIAELAAKKEGYFLMIDSDYPFGLWVKYPEAKEQTHKLGNWINRKGEVREYFNFQGVLMYGSLEKMKSAELYFNPINEFKNPWLLLVENGYIKTNE